MKYVKTVEEALAFAQEQMLTVRKQISDDLPAPKQFTPFPKLAILSQPLDAVSNSGEKYTWGSKHSYDSRDKITERKIALTNHVRAKLAEAAIIHETNASIGEHNTIVKEQVTLIMKTMGIPDTYNSTVYKRNNATSVSNSAGYITDLARCIPSSDGYAAHESALKRKIEEIDRWANKLLETIIAEEQKRKIEEENRQRLNFIATARVRYNLDYDADAGAVMKKLLDSNHMLQVAHYLRYGAFGRAMTHLQTHQSSPAEKAFLHTVQQGETQDEDLADHAFVLASNLDTNSVMDYDLFYQLDLHRIGVG